MNPPLTASISLPEPKRIAYAKSEKKSGLHCGRSRKKGEYPSLHLSLAIKLYQKPQFVLVKYDNVITILATTDLESRIRRFLQATMRSFNSQESLSNSKKRRLP